MFEHLHWQKSFLPYKRYHLNMLNRNIPRLGNWLNGKFTEPSTMRYIENINPFTRTANNLVPESSAIDVNNAVDCALKVLPEWSSLTSDCRAQYLLRIAQEIENNSEKFAMAESMDTGKPLSLSRNLDIARSAHNFRFFAETVMQQQHLSYEQNSPQSAVHHIIRRPVGVAGLISPWNLPLYLLSWKIAPALVSGCTIVAKPSELTPTTANLLAEATQRAGLPPGVLNIVHGLGSEVGSSIVGHKDIKAISFTGGTSTGAMVATQAAPLFKKVSLELGGKNPAIVMADADLDVAVKGVVRSSFLNSGQICLCGSRAIVHEAVYDEFIFRLKSEVEKLRIGDPFDPATDLGPVISEAHLNKIRTAVESAISSGAEVVTGGPQAEEGLHTSGYVYPPTVLINVDQSSAIVQEEVFGPVLTVQKFGSTEEGLAMANGVRYGLAASLWTAPENVKYDGAPRSEAMTLAQGLDCGLVWVNCWLLRDLRVPFGGTKCSGVGREGGTHSLEFFSEVTSLCLADPAPIPPMPSGMVDMSSKRVDEKESPHKGVTPSPSGKSFNLSQAPAPVGSYAHSKIAGGLLFLAGVGPRTPVTNVIPGGPIKDAVTGEPLDYDIEAQTRACIENVITILEGSGSSLDKVVDVQCFLIDMDRDFATFNKVYAEYFKNVNATRTTIAIRALPTPIAVELKVVALP